MPAIDVREGRGSRGVDWRNVTMRMVMMMGLVLVMKPMIELQTKMLDMRGTLLCSLQPMVAYRPLLLTR